MAMTRSRLSIVFGCSFLVAAGCMSDAALDPAPQGSEKPPQFLPPIVAPMPTADPSSTDAGPPPISGGTLAVSEDATLAVAADPDRDIVWLVDLQTKRLRGSVQLSKGDEPGRVVLDKSGQAHVALRRGGAVVDIDISGDTPFVVSRRDVCAAPRGIAFDDAAQLLHVACAGGELVSLPSGGGAPVRTLKLDSDLRDVVPIADGRLVVSRFRSAELLTVDANGTVALVQKPKDLVGGSTVLGNGVPGAVRSEPAVAWRTVGFADGRIAMLHQRGLAGPISTRKGGYSSGGHCRGVGIVHTAVTVFSPTGTQAPTSGIGLPNALLSVDLAVSRGGSQFAMVSPAALMGGQLLTLPRTDIEADVKPGTPDPCNFKGPDGRASATHSYTAAAYAGDLLVLQSRQPALLYLPDTRTTISLTNAEDKTHPGHRIFHTPTAGLVACVSCHPEARDDSRSWEFTNAMGASIGLRRTQSLLGGILATAPFHWDGDMQNLSTLMSEVFTTRMQGSSLSPTQVADVGFWLDAQPTLPKSAAPDVDAVARGKVIYTSAEAACSVCHGGAALTNNASLDVGTGKVFQVPSLRGIVDRAPFIHTGCARTLRDRFRGECGGGDRHGKTSHLSEGQLDDLLAYLKTL